MTDYLGVNPTREETAKFVINLSYFFDNHSLKKLSELENKSNENVKDKINLFLKRVKLIKNKGIKASIELYDIKEYYKNRNEKIKYNLGLFDFLIIVKKLGLEPKSKEEKELIDKIEKEFKEFKKKYYNKEEYEKWKKDFLKD